jgi:hypothetical protein
VTGEKPFRFRRSHPFVHPACHAIAHGAKADILSKPPFP